MCFITCALTLGSFARPPVWLDNWFDHETNAKSALKDDDIQAVFVGETSFGKGYILAVGDPWFSTTGTLTIGSCPRVLRT